MEKSRSERVRLMPIFTAPLQVPDFGLDAGFDVGGDDEGEGGAADGGGVFFVGADADHSGIIVERSALHIVLVVDLGADDRAGVIGEPSV